MSLSNTSENNLLLLMFNNTNWANVGDATGLRGSTTAGSFYVSLHTASIAEAGSQPTNETSYTNYVRVAVARSSSGWDVTGTAPTQAANHSAVTFAQCGVTGATLTDFGVGNASSGAGEAVAYGALNSSLAVSSGITPSFNAGDLAITAD